MDSSMLLLSAILVLVYASFSHAQCPTPKKLPVSIGGKDFCARVFEHSHSDSYKSCRGRSMDLFGGDFMDKLSSGWNDRISAAVVQYNCRLTVWEHTSRGGANHKYYAGVHQHFQNNRKGFWAWNNWNDAVSSLECTCDDPDIPKPHRSTSDASTVSLNSVISCLGLFICLLLR